MTPSNILVSSFLSIFSSFRPPVLSSLPSHHLIRFLSPPHVLSLSPLYYFPSFPLILVFCSFIFPFLPSPFIPPLLLSFLLLPFLFSFLSAPVLFSFNPSPSGRGRSQRGSSLGEGGSADLVSEEDVGLRRRQRAGLLIQLEGRTRLQRPHPRTPVPLTHTRTHTFSSSLLLSIQSAPSSLPPSQARPF